MDLPSSILHGSRARHFVDLTATGCLLAGDTLGWILFPRARPPMGLSTIFWLGLMLIATRHLVWPRPTLFTVWWAALRTHLHGVPARRLLALVVVTRLSILAVGVAASLTHPEVFERLPRISRQPVENLPARWDAFWYHAIARNGYRWSAEFRDREQNVAFFPAYPVLMRVGGDLVAIPAKVFHAPALFGNGVVRSMWGGVLVSLTCFTLATLRLFRLAQMDTDDESAAFRACVLLGTYPFAVFFSAAYSESFALLALISLVLAWRQREVRGGVTWGLLLGLSRSNGWTITFALAADRLLRLRSRWHPSWAWVPIAAAPIAGAAAYSAYLYRVTGHAFAWVTAQGAWGGRVQPAWFFVRRWQAVQQNGLTAYIAKDPADAITALAVMVMVALAVYLAVRRQWLYALVMVAYVAPAIAIDLRATGRMTALLFPAFIVMGASVRGRAFIVLGGLFALCQAWFAWRFFSWSPPY